jgi:uncharacterized protein YutE (UPF0331/DUF86 family)
MTDVELITRKMTFVLEDLEKLRPIAAKGLDEYLSSRLDEVVAERYLERMIGRMIDMNYHILTEAGEPPPRDYYLSFIELSKLGLFPSEFGYRIAACAGLRNRISHEYDDIDPKKIHEAIQTAVKDIPEYLRYIQSYLDGLPAGS